MPRRRAVYSERSFHSGRHRHSDISFHKLAEQPSLGVTVSVAGYHINRVGLVPAVMTVILGIELIPQLQHCEKPTLLVLFPYLPITYGFVICIMWVWCVSKRSNI